MFNRNKKISKEEMQRDINNKCRECIEPCQSDDEMLDCIFKYLTDKYDIKER